MFRVVEGGGISGAYGDSDVRGQSGGEARGEGLGGPGGGGVEEGWDGGAGGAGGGGRFAAEPDRFVEEEEGGGGEEEKKGEVGGGGGGGRRREGRHRGGGACGRCRFGPWVLGVSENSPLGRGRRAKLHPRKMQKREFVPIRTWMLDRRWNSCAKAAVSTLITY